MFYEKILSFLLVTMMLLSFFTGCSTKNEIPDVVKNMKGGEKWETKIDYANTDNWLAINDTGIIVSYNTEGPGNKDKRNGVVKEGAISINPINWKRDETYAGISENKGSFVMGNVVEGLADAKVDLERGVIVCESVDPSIYAIAAPGDLFFGPESYHLHDYGLYYFTTFLIS